MKHYLLEQIELTNNNSIILGNKKSGKTFAAKIEIMRNLDEGKKVFVYDFHKKYRALCNHYNGKRIKVINGKEINIFDYRPKETATVELRYTFNYHILKVYEFLKILLNREVPSEERKNIINILEKYYYSFQIIFTFQTFLDYLKEQNIGLFKELAVYSNEFSTRTQTYLFDNSLNIIEFDMIGIEPVVQHSILYAFLYFVREDIREYYHQALIVYDNILPFMKNEKVMNTLQICLKVAKKYGTIHILIEESFSIFMKMNGEALFSNISTTMLLRQNKEDIREVSEFYHPFESRYGNRLDKIPLRNAVVTNCFGTCDVYIDAFY